MSADAYRVTVQLAWRFTPFILPLVSAMFITAVLAFAAFYLALPVGTILLVKTTLGESSRYRAQTAAVLLGVLPPWFANVRYLLALGPTPNVDLTPFAFCRMTSLCWPRRPG